MQLPDSVLIPHKYDSELINASIESGDRKLISLRHSLLVNLIASENMVPHTDPNDTVIFVPLKHTLNAMFHQNLADYTSESPSFSSGGEGVGPK